MPVADTPVHLPSNSVTDPNAWFAKRFPSEAASFGAAFMEMVESDENGVQKITPTYLNTDFFAGILRCDKRLGYQVVYFSADETFYFYDEIYDAFRPVSVNKLKLLISNYLIRCAQDCSSTVDIRNLVIGFREDTVLNRIISRAKAIPEADDTFFNGENGQMRLVDGKVIDPTDVPCVSKFAKERIVWNDDKALTVSEAYESYLQRCSDADKAPLPLKDFTKSMVECIRSNFGLPFQNDIQDHGEQKQGWSGICLRNDASIGQN
jgi:hypothetical protein